MAEALLTLGNVQKAYGTVVVTPVLHGINLQIERGEFTALIGPSGSGKSTLLHLIGLLDRPTSGEVIIGGRSTTTMNDAERTALRGRTLGFVFQFHHLLPAFTAVENAMMPMLAVEGYERPGMRERATELLRTIGLEDRLDYLASNLSGGQQQRVAIARALVMAPQLVLADEPTGNLDTETGAQVFKLLRMFNQKNGTAFLIVTHDSRIASQCDRVVELVDGRVVSDERRASPLPQA